MTHRHHLLEYLYRHLLISLLDGLHDWSNFMFCFMLPHHIIKPNSISAFQTLAFHCIHLSSYFMAVFL